MTVEGHKVASLHGAKDSRERDAIIDGFREGRDKVLSPRFCNHRYLFCTFLGSNHN
jgi:hypothetical protein